MNVTEMEFLRDHGGVDAEAALATWTPEGERVRRARSVARSVGLLIADSLTAREAADRLGIDRSQISRRITQRTMWAFTLEGVQRIPTWQFDGASLLPGLVEIVPSIPPHHSPIAVAALMRTEREEFDGISAIEYLKHGSDPALVARTLAELAQW